MRWYSWCLLLLIVAVVCIVALQLIAASQAEANVFHSVTSTSAQYWPQEI
jgi:hypothetical protein